MAAGDARMTYLHALLIVAAVVVVTWIVLRLLGDLIAWWTDTIEEDWHD
jgi:hypothetical protein